MKAIRILLVFSALIIVLYPIWGIIDPQSYLIEILEVYPEAVDASDSQVRKAALLLLLSNLIIASALLYIAKFIASPNQYGLAKIAALCLIAHPFMLTIVEVISGSVLYKHLDSSNVSIEFSAIKMFYIIFGFAIIGIYKSQSELNK